MAVLVKICGINAAEAADAAARAGADFAGLVFHPRSPRHVTPDQAATLAARLRGRLRLVVLLSDPSDEAVAAAMAAVRPDFIQLHGGEPPGRVAAIRSRFGVPVIKAIAVAEPSDLAGVAAYEDAADMLLFDAKAPVGATREGGHGIAFDWKILSGRKFARPWFLSGGLNPENVARALRIAEAPGVDVSSGVESAPGVKSPEKIAQFVSAARNAQFGAAA
ncbi:MAG: phosphoribosylanthranilate isomerase [Rhizomicrobium sp.]